MNEKMKLFLENNNALQNIKGSWSMYEVQKKSSALILTIKNKRIDTERINLALKIIKDNTSVFSNFRGNNKLNTAIAISLEEDMEKSLKEIIFIYNKLKEEFSSSEYLIIAAQIIFNSKERVNIDDAIRNTRVAYDYMKKNHKFLTGREDISSAAIIATTSSNFEQTFNEIEECYEILKRERISSSNNVQGLSHILSLMNLSSKDKCEKVIEMNSVLRENKVSLKDFYLPLLGIISFLTNNKEGFAKNVADLSKDLKKYKGFGNFTLGSQLRNMISVVLVSMDYLDTLDSDLKSSLIDSTNNVALTVVIAMQTAIIAASSAAAAAAASSSSS
ncbi:DUF4003 family protein [Clostridioides difficile]